MFNKLLRKQGRPLKLSSKLIIIALLLVLGFGSMAWRTSRCTMDVDTVPLQIIYTEAGPLTTLSKANLSSTGAIPGFSNFVPSVTEYLAAKLTQEKFCLNSAESKKFSLLQFVHLPVNSVPRVSVQPLEAGSFRVCRITSPWMDLVVEHKPVPLVRGVFRYNERQLLADQAVLAGARDVPPGVAIPISGKEFNRYADLEYAPSEIHHQPAEKPIEERVPPDLLWLFHRASQDPVYDLSGLAGGSMRLAMRASTESYTKIVTILIDRCFESDGEDIHYDSILDIDDHALLEEYKIDMPVIPLPK